MSKGEELSPGQIALRQHVKKALDSYQPKGRLEYAEMTVRMLEQFSQDPRITTDVVTAQPLEGSAGIKAEVTRICAVNRWRTVLAGQVEWPARVQYIFDLPLNAKAPLWCLGDKGASTGWALAQLALGNQSVLGDWDIIYLPQLAVVLSGADGRHRTLAHILWGHAFPPNIEVSLITSQ